ncbi:MAG: carboxypeptidase-like regulatory domain-containing protein [Armatimonadota bacterium]
MTSSFPKLLSSRSPYLRLLALGAALLTASTVAAAAGPRSQGELEEPLASLEGTVRQSNRRPLVEATVRLVDLDGNPILDVDGEPLETRTDAEGRYQLAGLDSFAVDSAAALQIHHPIAINWNDPISGLTEGQLNVRDYRYGSMRVVVTGNKSVRRQLEGTQVNLEIGSDVVATNMAVNGVRVLKFPNVPATSIAVRAFNPRLTGTLLQTKVKPGKQKKVRAVLRPRGIF